MTRFAIALLTLAACGDDGAPTLPDAALITPREVITATKPLRVLELFEGTMTGGPGDTAVIKLSAPNPKIGWNIHGHANGSTQIIYEERDKAAVEYTFSPTAQADWYLLVRNEAQTNMEVMMTVELYGTMAWTWL